MADETPPARDPDGHQPDAEPDRMAQPVDAEQPPWLPFPVVGVGASAGGIEAFGEFLAAMRPDGGMAFVFVLHLSPDRESHLPEILARRTAMPVRQVEDGMPVEADHVYVIRPGHVLTVRDGRLRLGPELGGPRAANRPVDDLFRSLAAEQRERAVCVVLSGMGSNGAAGAQAVKAVGGLCIAQDPESAQYPSMPRHMIESGYADHILRPPDMPEVLLAYAGSPYARGGREADARAVLDREHQHLREILAVLRTRSRQDFAGYKKPTLLRRVQRRMGLNRIGTLAEYARLLRQTPAEVTALADDLLIHVTGFFRDPDAWDALRRQVVVPLVAGRAAGGDVRAWVAACSSGEEAYTLAILLVEEAERADKPLDIKVFATDLADRTLAHARAGVYPGGIESEVTPERLDRFFTREAEVYRVRADLRDRVVFASQNILQDPPFSRLDVATCRNLLIYLEPDVQLRVLHLLHFGLRDGGALFLGSSETAAAADGLFELVDKKARIFRRVGPTRHGAIDFPLPHPIAPPEGRHARAAAAAPAARPGRPAGPPASVDELTRQALLDAHNPPAVTVDRDGQVVYFHGDAAAYLRMTGEPTRDLLLMAREGVRGAAREALRRAAADHARVTVPDGWVDREPGRRVRVAVTASPVADPAAYFVVSFDDRGEIPAPGGGPPDAAGGWDAEVRRLRGELQGTIEQLQSSNEELTASNEEVTSVNEELQSANEELETSKEEMQSLNEELTTVNAQLRAKMEEHQAAAGDLSSLLTSTDIAVLFLDTALRIRRFTPAAQTLIDLIPGDVGRPITALARRFDDPHLDADCRAVLERLVPAERAVAGADGRHYQRRVTPYRTVENRIDGAVITFVDVTARTRAEEVVRERGAWLRGLRAALEAAVNNEPLEASLGELVNTVTEAGGPGTRAAFYLADGDGTALRHVVGMPAEYAAAVDGFETGPESLAVGPAAHPGEPVLTADVTTDPRWEAWRGAAARFDYRGCWSFPIHTAAGAFVGTMAVYSRQPRAATERDLELAALLTPTAAVIIARHAEAEARRRAGVALRRSEERLRLALAAARMGIWTLDVGTGVQMRDANLNDLLGLAAADTTLPFGEFLTHVHPDDRAGVREVFAAATRDGHPLNVEFRVVRPDGGVRWLRDQGDVLGDARAGTRHLAGACVDVTDLKEAEAALRVARDRLEERVAERTADLGRAMDSLEAEMDRRRGLARRLATAQEDERRRVARDLHDTVGQLTAALSLAFKAMETSGGLPPPTAAKLADAQRILSDVGRELHGLAVRLRPTSLDDIGLEAALGQLVSEWSSRSGVRADFHAAGLGPGRLPAEVETTVYRVVQEALTNVAKHARAARVSVVVTRPAGSVSVVVEDDGAGFDPDAAPTGRIGLLGMRERVELVGGELCVESSPGAGATVAARIPVPEEGAS